MIDNLIYFDDKILIMNLINSWTSKVQIKRSKYLNPYLTCLKIIVQFLLINYNLIILK